MSEIEKKEEKNTPIETFFYMLRTTRHCAKKCNTLKVSGILEPQDNECLSLFL